MVRHSIAIILLPLVLAAPARQFDRRDTAPIYDGSQVNGKTYDYVIAGGGLTGAVLAARLTEDSTKSVLVVESGYNEENNPDVTGKSVESLCLGCLLNGRRIEISKHLRGECSSVGNSLPRSSQTWIDWQFQTVPQSSANNQPQTIRAGRALGGSTTINGMAWSKPHTFQASYARPRSLKHP
jgi:choline dehydrogenase-like flavoprotein